MIFRLVFVRPCWRILVFGMVANSCHFFKLRHFIGIRHFEILLESLYLLLEIKVVAIEKRLN